MKELQKQLELLEGRRAELEADRQAMAQRLDGARLDLEEGKDGAISAVTAAQSQNDALNAALDATDDKIAAKSAELADAQAQADRAAKIARLSDLAAQSVREKDAAIAAIMAASNALQPHLKTLGKARAALYHNRSEWLGIAQDVAPGIRKLSYQTTDDRDGALQRGVDELLAELRAHGADLTEVLARYAVGASHTVIDQEPFWPEVPFGEFIWGAYNSHYFQMDEKNTEDENGLLTIPQVAQKLSVNPMKVYKMCWSGELPHVRVGRNMRIQTNDLDAFIKSQRRSDDAGN